MMRGIISHPLFGLGLLVAACAVPALVAAVIR